ncbi:hypothetical protein RFI_11469 [Reticulomyxa filosa]|uniref:Globin family profile domain-containing protein n=1 Tax=Reticulomyxa filosa TaxID=46433 RepID=X6NIV1_RETFI|nr:hypothetical protein RFI_11469 [Reticulomyxa filosa]|eukprot:ETO25669.1 hypothetical protein RFI_11469 [Reticulomyxa filosa]
MVELGKVHNTYGVQLSQLHSFGDVLTESVRRNIPLKWTEEHTKAWQWFWKIVVDLFSRGMLEHIEEKKELEDLKRERVENETTKTDEKTDSTTDVDEAADEEFIFDLKGRYTHSRLGDHESQADKKSDEDEQ